MRWLAVGMVVIMSVIAVGYGGSVDEIEAMDAAMAAERASVVVAAAASPKH